jgi:Fic family protein
MGIEYSKIDISRLQRWVDLYHSYSFNSPGEKLIVGYILYLLYERIHPHEDGNGRMGRYLFIENKLSYFQFDYESKDNLYSETSFRGYLGDFHMSIQYKNEADYYKLTIGNKLMSKIMRNIESK